MVQILDRYRRVSDGKAFAVVRLGEIPTSPALPGLGRTLLLESEDGERVESQESAVRTHGRFERIEE